MCFQSEIYMIEFLQVFRWNYENDRLEKSVMLFPCTNGYSKYMPWICNCMTSLLLQW